jgi:hypothetical protein
MNQLAGQETDQTQDRRSIRGWPRDEAVSWPENGSESWSGKWVSQTQARRRPIAGQEMNQPAGQETDQEAGQGNGSYTG